MITKYRVGCYEKELCQNLKNSLYILSKIVTFSWSTFGRLTDSDHFYPSTLSTAVFLQRFSFLTVCSVQWPRGVPHVTHRRKKFLNLGLQIAGNVFFLDFSWVSWAVLKKSWLERYMQLSFMYVWKYLNQRVRKIGEQNGKSFKNKNEKTTWRKPVVE